MLERLLTYLHINHLPSEYLWVGACIIIFICTGIFLLGLTLFYRTAKIRRRKQLTVIQEQTDLLIQEILFDQKNEQAIQWIEKQAKKNKQFFLNRLLIMSEQFSGEYKAVICNFYNLSPLPELSLDKFKKRDGKALRRAVKELTELHYNDIEAVFEKRLSKEKNSEIQLLLQMNLMKINPEKGIYWILNKNSFLTEWHQLLILKELNAHVVHELPPFNAWMKKNETLKILACRIAANQNRFEDTNDLLVALKGASETLKREIIRTLAKLEYEYLSEVMEQLYLKESTAVRMEIVKAYQLLKNKNKIPFLLSCLEDGHFELNMEILRAVFTLNEQRFEGITMPHFEQTNLLAIQEHIKDQRI